MLPAAPAFSGRCDDRDRTLLTSLVLGALVGAILGLTGAGGGILAVPALVVGLGWSMQQAAPVALIAVAGGAAVGAAEGLRKSLVRYKAAILMATVGVPFTWWGNRAAQMLPQRTLLVLFAAAMLLVAGRLLLEVRKLQVEDEHDRLRLGRLDSSTGRFAWTWSTAAILGSIGAVAGFLTGLLGVGGGFVIVPMLRRFTNVSMQGVVATSLLVIALVGLAGVVSAVMHGASLPLTVTSSFTVATACGMLIGRYASSRLPSRYVQMAFSIVLVLVALGLIAKAVLDR